MPPPDKTARDPAAPRLSVAVLNHNYGRYLPQCLDSILGQTWPDFELIILDDASTDDSWDVISRYAGEPRVRAERNAANLGYVPSLLLATDTLSRGEFLMVISADDFVIDRGAFEKQMAALFEDESAVLCFSAYEKVGAGAAEVRRPLSQSTVLDSADFLRCLVSEADFGVLHSGAVMRACAYRSAGGYRHDLRHYVDFAMWAAIGATGKAAYVGEPLYAYRLHESQLSGRPAERRIMLDEGIPCIEEAAALARRAGVRVSTQQALRARIADPALAEAFADRRRAALARAGDALRACPWICLRSRSWWISVVRATAGRRVWAGAARLRAALR
ncbi:MAG: glycosyltransferase [Chloroflexi bacterium]|nr:glycosyltransferase [Chloroflexota bacterium]